MAGRGAERPYKTKIYHPFNWRSWQDFGSGQLGDFGCHILDPIFMALDLTAPSTVRAEAPPCNREVWTDKATVYYEFPGTSRTAGESLRLTWSDGQGALPSHSVLGLDPSLPLPLAGSLLQGELGSLLIPHYDIPRLLPAEKFQDFKLPEIASGDHYVAWADACRGEVKTTSHFDYAGPLTEAVLLGTIAIRTPGETLEWDPAALKIKNSPAADAMLTKPYRQGWEVKWT